MRAMGLSAGATLAERYRLAEVLGSGGTADVWRAVDLRTGRDAAVKLLRAACEDTRDRARLEASVQAPLRHPGIVRLLDHGVDRDTGRPWLALDLVDGRSLAETMAPGAPGSRLTAVEVVRVGLEIASALEFLHARDVVHGDLKPANILLDASGRSHLCDFGIAHHLGRPVSPVRPGSTTGTRSYLAPEQARTGAVGPAVDVHALGLVLMELLTGRRALPLAGRDGRAHPQWAPAIPTSLGASWCSLLRVMTAVDPQARPTAPQVSARLAAFAVSPAMPSLWRSSGALHATFPRTEVLDVGPVTDERLVLGAAS